MANNADIDKDRVGLILSESSVITKDSTAYNVYECGCVIAVADDPQLRKWVVRLQLQKRVCPRCDDTILVSKYKRCQCGEEQFAWGIGDGEFCKFCNINSKSKGYLRNRVSQRRYKNEALVDSSRWDCVRKSICREEWNLYDAIPCKKCGGYVKGNLLDTDNFNPFSGESHRATTEGSYISPSTPLI